MSSGTSARGRQAGGAFALLAMLFLAAAHPAPAAISADSAETWLSALVPHSSLGETVFVPAQRTNGDTQIHTRIDDSAEGGSAGAAAADLLVRLHHAFGGGPGLPGSRAPQNEGEVSLKNSDAFLRANMRLGLGNEWRGFVYADIGATDSELRWQGLAGMHHRRGVDLLGGWRHVTYRFSPGQGFDSLEFKGPFLGASLAW